MKDNGNESDSDVEAVGGMGFVIKANNPGFTIYFTMDSEKNCVSPKTTIVQEMPGVGSDIYFYNAVHRLQCHSPRKLSK